MKAFSFVLVSLFSLQLWAMDCTVYGPNDRIEYLFNLEGYFEGQIFHRLSDGRYERMRGNYYSCGYYPMTSLSNSTNTTDLWNFSFAKCSAFMGRYIDKDWYAFHDHYYEYELVRNEVGGVKSNTAKATLYQVKYVKDGNGIRVPTSRHTILKSIDCRLY